MKRLLLILIFLIFATTEFVFSKNNVQDATKFINPNVFRIVVASGTYTDEAVIVFDAAALDIFENYDSEKMFSPDINYPQTYYTTSDNVDVAIDGVPLLTSYTEKIIPLCFRAQVAGTFTFQATNLAEFDSNVSIYLEDVQENIIQDLRLTDTYLFTSGIIDTKTRFKLHFITPTSVHLMNWLGTSSSDWSVASNWNTNSIPTINDNVYISSLASAQPHITNVPTTPSVCNTLTIYSGASLTINAGKALSASGTTTNSGTFTIESDASGTGSFIDNGSVTGNVTVKKYLEKNRWWYLGAPLSNATAAAFGTLSGTPDSGNRLYYWDEAGQAYVNTTNIADAMPALRGYSFKDYDLVNPVTAIFTGTLNTGSIGNASNLTMQASGTFNGYNLVSNPYPSAINWGKAGHSSGVTQTNLEPSLWYRNNSVFATYNYTSGIGANGADSIIPAMQAFWVRVASIAGGGVQMTNAARLHSAHDFYKTTTVEANIFRMTVSAGTTSDETVVGFFQDAQDIFENFDSEKMFATDFPQLYSVTSDNTEVAINGQEELAANEERIVPVGFSANVAGTFTLDATNLIDFDPSVSVYLEDVQQSVLQDLHQNASYTFTSGVANTASRFKLHFGNMVTNISTLEIPATIVYADDNAIYVNTPATGTIEIFNVIGEKINDVQAEKGLNKFTVNTAKGIYIVKVHSGSSIITKKVFIGK